MKGNNELHFNEATIIEALQEYLDRRLQHDPTTVTSVKANSSGYATTFVVSIVTGESDATSE